MGRDSPLFRSVDIKLNEIKRTEVAPESPFTICTSVEDNELSVIYRHGSILHESRAPRYFQYFRFGPGLCNMGV